MPAFTLWTSLATTTATTVEVTSWDEVFQLLEASGLEPFKGDMRHRGWSAAKLNPPERKDAHVVAMTALVLDYDGDGNETLDDALSMWSVFYGFVHTTRRHTETQHRFRVVLPFDRDVSAAEYALIWRFVVATCGHRIDVKTKNPSRFWFLPGPEVGSPFVSMRLTGAVMAVDPIIAEARAEDAAAAAAARTPPNVTRIHGDAESRADRYARGAFEDACNAAASAVEGTRNRQLFLAACCAGNFIASGLLSESYAQELLETSAQVAGLPRFEALKTIRSGLQKGKQSPRRPPEPSSPSTSSRRARPAPGSSRGSASSPGSNQGGGSADSADSNQPSDPGSNQAEARAAPPHKPLSAFVRERLKPIGQRLKTGFSTLDEATRGGIPLGRLVILAGAPGAAKTTLTAYLADRWERTGCAVVYLAADESAEGVAIRFGQLAGFSRDSLESEGEIGDAVRAGFAARSEGRPLVVLDPDDDETCAAIEDAEMVLDAIAEGRQRVLVVDSLQTARAYAADDADGPRERIDLVMKVLKRIAKRGVLVLAISEMSRAGYRSNNQADNISALAAGKESGSIEYGTALLLGLRSVKGVIGQVDVEVAKNRLGGQKPRLRIKLDPDRASFVETVAPAEVDGGGEAEDLLAAQKAEARLERARQRVLAALRKHTDLSAQRDVVIRAGGTAATNYAALRELIRTGVVVFVNGAFRIQVDVPQDGSDEPNQDSE